MREPDDKGDEGGPASGRQTAAALIAELWSEREGTGPVSSPPPAPPTPPARPLRRDVAPADRPVPTTVPTGASRGVDHPDGGQRTIGPLVAVVLVALLLGAGFGVFIASQGFGRSSRTAFVSKAEAACRPASAAINAVVRPTSYPELATAVRRVVVATEAQLAGLRPIPLPGGADGPRARAMITAIGDTNQASRELQDAAGRMDDAATAAATDRLRTSADDAATKARNLGVPTCASSMRPGTEALVAGGTGILKTAFLAKADTLCRAGARTMGAIPAPRTNTPREVGRYLGETLNVSLQLTAELKSIPVPPGDADTVADAMTILEQGNTKWQEARDAALGNDRSRLLAVEQELALLNTAGDAKLDAYGLTSCGSNFRIQ